MIGIELRGCGVHPAAWRRDDSRADEVFGARYWRDLVGSAERAGLDLVIFADSIELQTAAGGERGWLDAAGVAATVAPVTSSIGLVPQVSVTHSEPFHVSKSIASLDFASAGRAGWEVTVSPGESQARLFGRKPAQSAPASWREADDAIEVVTRLWDSWEDDAEIRDTATGRFVDRDRLHYIDFVGEYFSVKGPSITPRPPQGQPIVVVRDDGGGPASAVAAGRADIVRIAAADLGHARSRTADLRSSARRAGRDPNRITVLLDVVVHLAGSERAAAAEVAVLDAWSDSAPHDALSYVGTPDGLARLIDDVVGGGAADGVVLRPLAAAAGVARLAGLSSGARPAGTFRERLSLARPASRYTTARG